MEKLFIQLKQEILSLTQTKDKIEKEIQEMKKQKQELEIQIQVISNYREKIREITEENPDKKGIFIQLNN